MKRFPVYLVLAAVLLWVPVRRTDVGKLRPVQVIAVYEENGQIILETDTQDRGIGKTGMEALNNLKATTPAVIYLDTADFLLMGDGTDDRIAELEGRLKKSVKLCRVTEKMNLKDAAAYLRVHKQLPSLKVWKTGIKIPYLQIYEGRFILSQNL